jgi:branched-chain amino acid transport system permease protein
VIGGLGSIRGAVLAGIFVSILPKVLDKYSDSLPFLAAPGSGSGVEPAMAANFAFGAAIIVVLIFAPGGLGSLGRRLQTRQPVSVSEPAPAKETPV